MAGVLLDFFGVGLDELEWNGKQQHIVVPDGRAESRLFFLLLNHHLFGPLRSH